MDTQSQHLIADIVLKNDISENDISNLKLLIEKNFTVVNRIEHRFNPHGETIVFILAESHFSVHTYPEHKYISLDIYVCNPEINLEKTLIEIRKILEIEKIDFKILDRGRITEEEKRADLKLLYFLTVIVAMGSILYELLIAQSLSTVMGNTALRYNVTIGIYIASMGFGAIFYNRILKGKDLIQDFLKVETLLSIIGGIAPLSVLIFDFYSNKLAKTMGISFYSPTIQFCVFTFNHLLIFLIGFISGLELPLLMNLGKKIFPTKGSAVLAFDYLGTLIGAIVFPLFLVPNFNLFTIGFLVSFLNILASLIASIRLGTSNFWKIFFVVLLGVWLLMIFNNQEISEYFINQFYLGGK